MDKVFTWRRVKVRFQASEKIVKIRAENLESAREKWYKFVDFRNMKGIDLDDFYYDTWHKNALSKDPDIMIDTLSENADNEIQILEINTE